MSAAIKSFIRKIFYRVPAWRALVGAVSVVTGRTHSLGIAHLLSYRDEDAIGPLQQDEAVALFGIVRTARPRTLVEFGYHHGYSAFNFLRALDREARLFSYDTTDEARVRAQELGFDRRFTFVPKSQAEFAPADIHGRVVDFVFMDGAHDLLLNLETFQRLLPHLAPEAIIAVHDTGLWVRSHLAPVHREVIEKGPRHWITEDLYAHQPDERQFVNWVTSEYRDFGAIHFHSPRTLRHGFTLLQRQAPLPEGGTAPASR